MKIIYENHGSILLYQRHLFIGDVKQIAHRRCLTGPFLNVVKPGSVRHWNK